MASIDPRFLTPFRAALFVSTAMIFAPSVAFAQNAPSAAAPAEVAEADEVDEAEIVVTAQRREERLQDVPISITAITGEDLREADIRDITRLEQVVPGLRVGRSGPAGRPAIRGVYTEAITANSDPRIGFYVDEIYQSRLQQTIAAFVDLERVEVQKGPQGTLFGRNSLGGNISLTSALPTNELDLGVAGIYGNYNRFRVEGFVNLPVSDDLAFRFAGAIERHDPHYRSLANERASVGDLNYQFIRGTMRFSPASLNDRLEVIVRGSYFNEDDRGLGSFNAKNLGAIVDASLIRQPGQNLTFNGVTYPFPVGYNGGNYATGVLVPFSPVYRDGIPDIGGADIGIPIGGKYDVLFDFATPENRIKSTNLSAVINFDLTDDIRLRSITGYTDFFFANRADGDGGPIPFREFYFITEAQTLTQELQIQSADSSSPLQYTFGAFYMDDEVFEGSASVFSGTNYTTQTAAASGYPVLYLDGGVCGYSFSPLNPAVGQICNINNTNQSDGAGPIYARTKSWAGYGQVSYTFADRLTLTAGARYTVDDKDYRSVAQVTPFTQFVGTFVANENAAAVAAGRPAPFPNAAGYRALFPFDENRANFANFECNGLTPGQFGAVGSNVVVGTIPNYFVTRCGQRDFKYWTYRLAADYQITPDNMVYISYSNGIHSGGFGAPFISTTVPQGEFYSFDEESVRAIEVGTRNSFMNNRLIVNGSVFYNRYYDNQVQGTQFVSNGTGAGANIATIANVGDTIAPGAEISVVARPTRRLTLRAAATYLHARNTVAGLGIFGSGLCRISTGSGPCVTNNLQTQAGVGSGFFPNPFTNPELFVARTNSLGVITGYDSLFFGEKTRVQNTPDWSGIFGASYEMPLSDGATLTPEVDVLYSGDYILSATAPNFIQEAYFKIDARLTYRADNGLSLQAFVQNLTDEATLGRITTGTLSAQGTYADPRTYGVRLGFRF